MSNESRQIKAIFQFFFFGNIYIGVLAGALVWANSVILGYVNHRLVWLTFFSAILIYNLDRLFSRSSDFKNSPERSKYIEKHIYLVIASIFISFVAILWLLRYLDLPLILIAFILFVFTVVYLVIFNKPDYVSSALKSSPKTETGHALWRYRISFLKPLLLAGVWASATVFLPLADPERKFSQAVYGLFVIRFIEYAANGVLFDFRDIAGDRENHKSNIFLCSSSKKIFFYTMYFLILDAGIALFVMYTRVLPLVMVSDLAVILFYIFLIIYILRDGKFSFNSRSPMVSSWKYPLLVDGILFLPVVYTILTQ